MTIVPVCAIVPTFNRASLLGESIDSILAGSAVPADILVLDDGSNDDTVRVAESYGPPVRIVRQSNAGKAAALNHALTLAGQPFIWILDDDDLARPDGLAWLHAALTGRPDAGFAWGRYAVFSHDRATRECREVLESPPDAESFHLAQLEGCSVLQPAMLVRRVCYKAVGDFDTRLLRSQDYDMLLRLARRFGGVEVPGVVFDQRQHDTPRGPAALRRRPASSVGQWRRFNRVIFERVRAEYDLDEYLPEGERGGGNARHRALVRRAALMARHGLLEAGLEDLRSASACEEQGLGERDARMVGRALAHRLPRTPAVSLRRAAAIVDTMKPASRDRLRPEIRAARAMRLRVSTRRAIAALPGGEPLLSALKTARRRSVPPPSR